MKFIRLILATSLGLFLPLLAMAQVGSNQPVSIIVPYGPGGVVDAVNRVVAKRLAEVLGQPVLVVNRPGADSNIGPTVVLQSAADGKTLLASASYFTANPLIEDKLHWDPTQFVPVARIGAAPNVLVVPQTSGANTVAEFVALAKASPELPVSDPGRGSPQRIAMNILERDAGIKVTYIQYKGGSSYVPDLMAGRLSAGFMPLNVVAGLVKSGGMKALAITSKERSVLLPNVPTLAESGYPEAGVNSWQGFHVLAGTPADVIRRLEVALGKVAADAGVRESLAALGVRVEFMNADAFTTFLREDRNQMLKLLKSK